MLRNNRVIFKSVATLKDLSLPLSDFYGNTALLDFLTASDYLYLGSDLPFNHRYIDMSVVNDVAATLTVEYWTGSAWALAVDVVDETAIAGVPLAKSGILSWQMPLYKTSWSWGDTEQMPNSGLETLSLYGLYWIRIKYSANLKATTALSYVGHKFSEDAELFGEYPSLESANLIDAFKTGKTTWKEQTLAAAEYIIQDLRSSNVIQSQNQILDWRLFAKASVHKTAEIIFRAFGDDYKDDRIDANAAYKTSLYIKKYNVDLDRDAILSEREKTTLSEHQKR